MIEVMHMQFDARNWRLEYDPDEMNVALVLFRVSKSRIYYVHSLNSDGDTVLTTDLSTARKFFTMTEANKFVSLAKIEGYYMPKPIPLGPQ